MSTSPIDTNPSSAKLRELAATFAVVTALSALHAALVRDDLARAAAIVAIGAVVSMSPLVPRLGRVVYVAWMALGVAIGRVTGPIVLAVVYFGVVVPLGVLGRALGRDRLGLARKPEGESYWNDVPRTTRKSDYFRPF